MASEWRGRILGLDAGDRRIGVAISDPDRHFALPLRSIERNGHEFDAIGSLVRDEEVTEVVVGLPLSLSGESGKQAQSATAFADDLAARLQLPVHLWDERLSTQEAIRMGQGERRGGRGSRQRGPQIDVDAMAASIILQAYLDRQRLAGPSAE